MGTIRDPAKAARRVNPARVQARINALKKRAQRDLDRLRELCRLSQQAESGGIPVEAGPGWKTRE